MFFLASFYIALALFVAGTLYKITTWFRFRVGAEIEGVTSFTRMLAAFRGVMKTLASRKVFTLGRVFLLDGVLQLRILRESFSRWLMHICIFTGFMLLLLMHALGSIVTANLFPQYLSTLNPYWFLRDLFGALVIIGVVIAIYRRFIKSRPYFKTNFQDAYAIIIIADILFSGILLNGVKITSYTVYQDMTYSYMGMATDEELDALEAYWVKNFGVVAPHELENVDEKTLEMGRQLNAMSCASCHSPPQSAPLSYGTAKMVSPAATLLDKLPTTWILWYIHYFACLIGLAYLPFSKMFHILTGPASLMVNAVMDKDSDPANMATRQALELDACTHCGICTQNCSMRTTFETIPNPDILPSEKIGAIKAFSSGKTLDEKQIRDLREGVFLCTNCRRCTVVCPVGINLQEMWFSVREKLIAQNYNEYFTLSPLSFYRSVIGEPCVREQGSHPAERALDSLGKIFPFKKDPEHPVALAPADETGRGEAPGEGLSSDTQTFSYCFGCETCTTVCPVAAAYDDAEAALDLLPHQIMHCLALGMRDATLGSGMLWNCLTCYQCQEQCPQGVKVTDIFYELKNLAIHKAHEKEDEQTTQTRGYA